MATFDALQWLPLVLLMVAAALVGLSFAATAIGRAAQRLHRRRELPSDWWWYGFEREFRAYVEHTADFGANRHKDRRRRGASGRF